LKADNFKLGDYHFFTYFGQDVTMKLLHEHADVHAFFWGISNIFPATPSMRFYADANIAVFRL
jgi:hypothetical protein